MQGIVWAVFVLGAAPALGNPLNGVCKPISRAVGELQWTPRVATSFCSSYLHISTVTKTCKTVSVTPTTTVVVTTVVVTTDGPTGTVTGETSYTTTTVTGGCQKRGLDARQPMVVAVPTPPCLKGKSKSAVSALCSCLDIHTPTTTVTPTFTAAPITSTSVSTLRHTTTTIPVVTITTTTPGSCECTSVPGFNVAVWEGTFPDEGDPTWPEFRPEYFKQIDPANSATQSDPGLAYQAVPVSYSGDKSSIVLYGINTPPTTKLVSSITAYFRATVADTYEFIFPNPPNDIGLVWVGQLAYAGWNRDNADVVGYLSQPCSPGSCSVKRYMGEGDLMPIRVTFANRGQSGSLQFAIYDSIGRNLVDSLVTRSCDGTTNPEFLPWGSEI